MNPLDLFILGVCMGAGRVDGFSGRFVFDDSYALLFPLEQLGIMDWWTRDYCGGQL